MKNTIVTIGCEGSTVEEFVAALTRAGIDLLIDVRSIAWSRKKGFSKQALADALAASDIEYVHLQQLGNPKEGRDAAHAGNHEQFREIFGRHLQTDEALRELNMAADFFRKRPACLMCFEADHNSCHRRIVADRLSEMTGLEIVPLVVKEDLFSRLSA